MAPSAEAGFPREKEFWLFGYGSLIWKPPPHHDLRVPGYITGFVRRFWQASEDHRGTPAAPGRVVTLLEREYWAGLDEKVSGPQPDKVYGTAYRIPTAKVEEVKQYLDIREINGYTVQYTTFYPLAPQPQQASDNNGPSSLPSDSCSDPIANCVVYIGLPENPQFLGLQTPDAVAEVIARSHGPSGKNTEYLFMLQESLQSLSIEDELEDRHVSDLVERVRRLLAEGPAAVHEDIAHEQKHIRSGHAGAGSREETEKTVVACSVGD